MKFLVQRVSEAKVDIDRNTVGKISKGYMVLVGIKQGDTVKEADFLINKLLNLRIFEDENEKMNLSLKDVGGELLVVSQFTLYGDTKKGNRPSYIKALRGEESSKLYELFNNLLNEQVKTKPGIFGAEMNLFIENDGPVTILLEK